MKFSYKLYSKYKYHKTASNGGADALFAEKLCACSDPISFSCVNLDKINLHNFKTINDLRKTGNSF